MNEWADSVEALLLVVQALAVSSEEMCLAVEVIEGVLRQQRNSWIPIQRFR